MKNKIITSLTHTGFDSGLRRRMSIRGQTLRRFLAMGLSASILGSSLFAQSFTEDPRILSKPRPAAATTASPTSPHSARRSVDKRVISIPSLLLFEW